MFFFSKIARASLSFLCLSFINFRLNSFCFRRFENDEKEIREKMLKIPKKGKRKDALEYQGFIIVKSTESFFEKFKSLSID